MPGDYEVGKWKTPKHTRWKKNQSGNPKGRPPTPKPDAASVVAVLDEPIPIKKGGVERNMPAFEVSVHKLVGRAINDGDIRAALEFLRLCDKYGVIAPAPAPPASSGNLTVPKGWDLGEFRKMVDIYGPPPWPGERSGLPESSGRIPDEGVDNE